MDRQQRPMDDDYQGALTAGSVDNRVEDQHFVAIGEPLSVMSIKLSDK